MEIIQVNNLKKHYRNKSAVDDISFNVNEGSCYGLLGPNGAGKTTTMEVIEDILPATGGSILYKGKPRGDLFRKEIGIQFQHTSLLNFLSVKETLFCYRGLYEEPAELNWIIDRCDLYPILEQRNNQLSGGQQQRLMLALALINRPELIFLDEPSTGLDPQSRHYLWDIINEIKQDGKTIVMTTHSMEEAEFLCDTIAIIDQGRIIAEGSPKNLITTYCKTTTIKLPQDSLLLNCLNNSDTDYTTSGGTISIYTEDIDETISRLIDCNISIREISVHSPNLEDVFLHLTGRKLRD